MKITLLKHLEVVTDKTIIGFNAIVETAKKFNTIKEFKKSFELDDRIQDHDYLCIFHDHHIDVLEVEPSGDYEPILKIQPYDINGY